MPLLAVTKHHPFEVEGRITPGTPQNIKRPRPDRNLLTLSVFPQESLIKAMMPTVEQFTVQRYDETSDSKHVDEARTRELESSYFLRKVDISLCRIFYPYQHLYYNIERGQYIRLDISVPCDTTNSS